MSGFLLQNFFFWLIIELMRQNFLFICFLFFFFFLFPAKIQAWGPETHGYLCRLTPELDCNLGDKPEFVKKYRVQGFMSHVCYSNKSDCPPRLIARYYLKQYYQQGRQNKELLSLAAHLFQDAACPQHWYSYRLLGNFSFAIFHPISIFGIENKIDDAFRNQDVGWSFPLKIPGQRLEINQNYLDNLRAEANTSLSQEPKEDLAFLKKQILSKRVGYKIRSYYWDGAGLVILVVLPIFFWQLKKYLKTKKGKNDVIVLGLFLGILFSVIVLGILLI
jgi:hypothetical protein